MGCASAKYTVESSMEEVSANPSKGLPNLLNALEQTQKETGAESAKKSVPSIFESLPKAIEKLDQNESKPVVAACRVIERCVDLHNDKGTGDQTELDGNHLKQCQQQLSALFQKVKAKAASTWTKDLMECETSSTEAKAIALATIALFKLEKHSTDCKMAMKESGGIKAAVKSLEADSGIKIDAKASIAWMLSSYVDQDFGNVEDITSAGGCDQILPYLEKGATKEMKENCVKVLEACLLKDEKLKNKEALKQAVEKYRSSSRRPSAQL